jgi:Rrf2 family transcriptional regulator, iron-sulfur cluster assembly transcription factor
MFSKSCEYALRAVIYLCIKRKENRNVSITEIAKEIESPLHFTSKILQQLSRNNLIHSTKGPKGGFFIEADDDPIPVISIIKAIDGNKVFNRCGLGLKNCSDEHPCPIHNEFKSYSQKLRDLVTRKSVQELADDISSGKSFLMNLKKVA